MVENQASYQAWLKERGKSFIEEKRKKMKIEEKKKHEEEREKEAKKKDAKKVCACIPFIMHSFANL